jgi:putative oxidoreductase
MSIIVRTIGGPAAPPAAAGVADRTCSPSRARARTVGLWALQALLASQFVGAGLVKVTGSPAMVTMFAEIGAGQWLRYFVGTVELAGAIGLLVPRLCGLAALGLVALMIGAAATNVGVLGEPPCLPIAYLLVAAAVAWRRWPDTRALVRTLLKSGAES